LDNIPEGINLKDENKILNKSKIFKYNRDLIKTPIVDVQTGLELNIYMKKVQRGLTVIF
jgi:hypothetical protein